MIIKIVDNNFIVTESCNYYYHIQPGSTDETCSLSNFQFIILQCQVSSDKQTYFIDWHYSRSRPDPDTIKDTTKSNGSTDDLGVEHEVKLEAVTEFNKTSVLTLSGFDVSGNGYYWCSVNSNSKAKESFDSLFHPSTVLHITEQNECFKNEQSCNTEGHVIRLHSPSSSVRCADRNVALQIVEAQSCTHTVSPKTTTQIPTATNTTIASTIHTLSHMMWIIIGASVGGTILVLLALIGLLLSMCLVKNKFIRRTRERRNAATEPSPFDDIRMYHSSVENVKKDKTDEKDRSSKVFCESNICYDECPHAYTSQPHDNIYEEID